MQREDNGAKLRPKDVFDVSQGDFDKLVARLEAGLDSDEDDAPLEPQEGAVKWCGLDAGEAPPAPALESEPEAATAAEKRSPKRSAPDADSAVGAGSQGLLQWRLTRAQPRSKKAAPRRSRKPPLDNKPKAVHD